ncbi:MAG: deoxyguanosinetriphosphate triphosphohydrolase family protein [Halobacteriaceae archaeon]
MYSREFRRLSSVTQVAWAGESYFYHDRLTHSLKASQVARSVANILINEREYDDFDAEEHINPVVAESAALAHDIGHPPFGHAAESKLNELVSEEHGGFEGNAQSFRIVANSANRRLDEQGLNLTLATYNAILKYPWGATDTESDLDYVPEEWNDSKWGYYSTEKEFFETVREHLDFEKGRLSVEAQIMDYADDVTYAIHDLDDFYRAGLIPLDRLLQQSPERERAIDYLKDKIDPDESEIRQAFEDLTENLIPEEETTLLTPFQGTDEEISEMNRLNSFLVERYLAPFVPEDLKLNEEQLKLEVADRLEAEISVLKELTFFYVIDNPSLASQQQGQNKIIERLFEVLSEAAEPGDDPAHVIPSPHRERIKELEPHQARERERRVVDIIVSMTETQALEMYKRLEGYTPGSVREGILK